MSGQEGKALSAPRLIFHYTDRAGYNAIRATVDWCFKASRPPRPGHPVGAYFTILDPGTIGLARRLRISRSKVAYVFVFKDHGGLAMLRGMRGAFVLYSPRDYIVEPCHQLDSGSCSDVEARRNAGWGVRP